MGRILYKEPEKVIIGEWEIDMLRCTHITTGIVVDIRFEESTYDEFVVGHYNDIFKAISVWKGDEYLDKLEEAEKAFEIAEEKKKEEIEKRWNEEQKKNEKPLDLTLPYVAKKMGKHRRYRK